jgi:stage V sporulation protein R
MLSVLEVVRKTSLYFQPQIRTKTMNEGWASYWHEKLFLQDERIKGHEVDFARVHAGVTSLPRVGLNPYALGMRLFSYLEELADKGKLTHDYHRLTDSHARDEYDAQTGSGLDFIFHVRENFTDFLFLNRFVDQEFVTRHKLFVAGKRLNRQRMTWQYYVKSRKAADYRQMLLDSLYHPPHVTVDLDMTDGDTLHLVHHFEGKPLVKEFIANTLLGIEFLWGSAVCLETSEVAGVEQPDREVEEPRVTWQRVVYRMEERKLSRAEL